MIGKVEVVRLEKVKSRWRGCGFAYGRICCCFGIVFHHCLPGIEIVGTLI